MGIINVLSLFYAFLVIVHVYKRKYPNPPSKKEVGEYQDLKKISEDLALKSILKQRKKEKIKTLFIAGAMIVPIMFLLSVIVDLTYVNINFLCFSGIVILLSSVVID